MLLACANGEGIEPSPGQAPAPASAPQRELAQASLELLPPGVVGVSLGMRESRLVNLRPAVRRQASADQPERYAYGEQIDEKTQAYYLFDRNQHELGSIQVMTTLPSLEAIPQRLAQLQQRFGPTTMAFDCPAVRGQQLPMRRFVWTRGAVAAADSYLLAGNAVAVTWAIEKRTELMASLGRSKCTIVSGERLATFPAATAAPTAAP